MSEIKDILALHDRASKQTEKLAFATVISTEGPSYRSAGSRSLVIEDGTFGGGLSAGCLERDIACRLDSNTAPFIVEYDLSEEDDIRGFPFGCGGTVQVFVEPLPNSGALRAVQWLSELEEPAVLITVVKTGATSECTDNTIRIGARLGISESGSSTFKDGLSDCAGSESDGPEFRKTESQTSKSTSFELAIAEFNSICKSILRDRKSRLLLVEIENQKLTLFAEFFEPAINIAIFGDGEDARILESLAHKVGLTAARISKHDVRSSISLIEEIPSLTRSYAVVMTHDLNLDTKILSQLTVAIPPYLGVMGPRSRTEKILTSLGLDPSTILNRGEVYAPVGLNMSAETPSEIALSIIAEIQTVSRKVQPKHLRDSSGAIHDRWQKSAATSCDARIETIIGA